MSNYVYNLWPTLLKGGLEIFFANRDFKWSNLAAYNAGVIVSIIGVRKYSNQPKYLPTLISDESGETRRVANISAYLTASNDIYIETASKPLGGKAPMVFGNMPIDGGHLSLSMRVRPHNINVISTA